MKLTLLVICFFLISQTRAQDLKDSAKILNLQAPHIFKAQFKTTQGDFIIEVHRQWSPKAADRLYQLITTNYYNNNIVFRATPKYVQFGITDSKTLNDFWDRNNLPDEPVLQSNTDSSISFASGGPNTRSAQIFINMRDNLKLDTTHFMGATGFPPVGKIIEGMNVIRKFNTRYGDSIAYNYQDSIYSEGNNYLIKNFPGLDSIISTTIIQPQ